MPSSATTKTPFPLAFESHYPFLFQDLVNKTRSADVDKPRPNDYRLDWGNKVTGTSDNSKNGSCDFYISLFVYVNETLYQRPVYANFITVVQKNLFTLDVSPTFIKVCKTEASTPGFRESQIQLLFGNKHATDLSAFKAFFFNLWFGTYFRCNGTDGSSGQLRFSSLILLYQQVLPCLLQDLSMSSLENGGTK
ncbi:hypothetical protein ANCCAN_24987 [Ancylostoma caninum]|uniref:Uncharacterized protein n=1 Tax=Ancylostoma caninum TaxID=29170 RepID=A0A368FEM0_ANCCA|nr:hypothetical protein ANCCAN_24987 [Ancylostoma caninum]